MAEPVPGRRVRHVEYDEICWGVENLCSLIAASPDGWRPDAVAAIIRGGMVPAIHVCHYFEAPIHFIYFIHDEPLLSDLNYLSGESGHRRVLVVDEINDTGDTLGRVRDEIFAQPPQDQLEARYAVLYTRHTTNFTPEYFLDYEPFYLTDETWQVFPWEKN